MSTLNQVGQLLLYTLTPAPSVTLGGGAINDNFGKLSNCSSFRSTWVSGTAYFINDIVLDSVNNLPYVAIQNISSSSMPPSEDTSNHWALISPNYLPATQSTDSNSVSFAIQVPSGSGKSTNFTIAGSDDGHQYANLYLVDSDSSASAWFISHRSATNNLEFFYLGGSGFGPVVAVSTAGNLLLGSETDDGVNKLQVSGSIAAQSVQLAILSTAPGSPQPGMIYFDGSSLYLYAGGAWKALAFA